MSGCLLNYGEKACRNARKRDCPDVLFTNADILREMDNKELAVLLAKMGADPDRLERAVQSYSGEAVNQCMDFLEYPVEEL